jgi:hypothetical protein
MLRRGELDRARALRMPHPPVSVGSNAPILFVSNDFTTLAGSQIYATRWRDDLERRGLPVASCDVLTLFARDRAEVAQNVGALVTWGDSSQHVVRRFFGAPLSPPLVALTGNVADSRTDPGWLADLVVCSTQHAVERALYTGPSQNGGSVARHGHIVTVVEAHAERPMSAMQIPAIVLHPPIAPVYFETPILPLSERRAIVQINMSKRPEIFEALARALPDVPFIAVRGYGVQQIPALPNVRELPQAPGSPMLAYREARVLIQPGIESYGLAAAEAGAMEAATLVNRKGPGAHETLPTAEVTSDESEAWIHMVRWALSAEHGSARALLMERQRAELDAAADALARLMGR